MDGLLGSDIVKGDIDIYWMSVNHIGECFRALYLLCYGELDFYVNSLGQTVERSSHLEQLEE
jgi:hypothetical protein